MYTVLQKVIESLIWVGPKKPGLEFRVKDLKFPKIAKPIFKADLFTTPDRPLLFYYRLWAPPSYFITAPICPLLYSYRP